jgi:hypothetical protein
VPTKTAPVQKLPILDRQATNRRQRARRSVRSQIRARARI